MNNSNKIIIVGDSNSKITDVIGVLTSYDEDILVAYQFTTDIAYKDIKMYWRYYMDNEDLKLSYKNNALLCVSTDDDQISTGITKIDFENSDVCFMNYKMFNNIAPRYIQGVTVVWIDSNANKKTSHELLQCKEFMKAIKNYKVLYFTKEEDFQDIGSTLYRYMTTDSDGEKEKILKECS